MAETSEHADIKDMSFEQISLDANNQPTGTEPLDVED